jgi:tetratricopeptide (TPR) repeat protein
MVISVLERRAEIGLRRSLGATRGQIRLQFITESLLLAALGGLIVAAVRSTRLGPGQRALAAAALASTAYWLTHTSVDWFWAYPALTAPVFFLLGAACAPLVSGSSVPITRAARVALVAAGGVLALSVVPPFLSERYVDAAYDEWRRDIERAYRDLDSARALNPLTDEPLLAEGAIAREAGDRPRAIDAFRRAVEKRPEEYAGHYFLVLLYGRAQPDQAREELRRVRERDPLNPELERLESLLSAPRAPGP